LADPLLSTAGLVVGHPGRLRIEVADWEVRAGDIWAVLGPNGGGKSTLLDTLAGLVSPLAGAIALSGRTLSSLSASERAQMLASVAQREETPEGFTVRQAVVMGRLPQAAGYWESEADWARAAAGLMRLDLTELAERRCEETSGGEFQRALIARALASEAPLVLLDEPTSSIDAEHVQRLGDVLREEAGAGRGVIVSTHNLEWAVVFADRFLVVDEGRARPIADRTGLEAWIKERFARGASLQEESEGRWALSMGYRRA
jgi:ABC-type cobalamin/Fe3+-siderophores transport system ATPase subunit